MGYQTEYRLHVDGPGDQRGQFFQNIPEIIGSPLGRDEFVGDHYAVLHRKWYGALDDLTALSNAFPALKITCMGWGENDMDMWVWVGKAGKVAFTKMPTWEARGAKLDTPPDYYDREFA